MAITIADGPKIGSPLREFDFVPGSARAQSWVALHSNVGDVASAGGFAAETAAVLRRPLSATTAGIIARRIFHPVGRVIVRLKYPQAVQIAATHPVVRLYSIFGEPLPGATAFLDDGSVQFMRLDAQAANTAGLTLTVANNANDLRDTTFCYSAPSSLAGLDLQCGAYLMGLVETAGIITAGGAGAIELQALLQN